MLKKNLMIAVIFIAVLFVVQTAAQTIAPGSTIVIRGDGGAGITINDNTTATPYPSTVTVSGINPAVITRVDVVISRFFHTFPDDVDIVLVGPNGQRVVLMSDAGGNPDVLDQTLRFTPTATATLPDEGQIVAGTYRPVNYGADADNFPAPGPGATGAFNPTGLEVFNGTNPNGDWKLFVVDDANQDTGVIFGGWSLTFTVPQVFTVTNTNDAGAGSLREAITQAQDGDLINFSSLFNTPQTINLLTALPDITRSITINGTGANLLTVRRDFNAATNFRIFTIAGGITNGVAISGMTITGGNAGNGVTFGGGIDSESHLTLTNVHVTGNTAGSGGGVALGFADGSFTNCTFSNNSSTLSDGSGGGINYQGDGGRTLRLVSSTVSGNRATNVGGGTSNISNTSNTSRLEITNSTIANNTAGSAGGIVTKTQTTAGSIATTTLRNTIVAGNSPDNLVKATGSGNGTPTFETLGFNLSDNYNGVFTPIPGSDITAQPRLAPLALYGGQTPTHALLGGSPAIDAGNASGLTTDQRGQARVVGTNADIGAVEMRHIISVQNTNNSGLGSLRQAVIDANSLPDLTDIIFSPTVFNTSQTITLTTGELPINSDLNIIAPGANLLTVSGNNNSRVFFIDPGITAILSGMTITGGNGVGATLSGTGGGILNRGNLTVSNSTVTLNTTSGTGGGIRSSGSSGSPSSLTISDSTISHNTASDGGGIASISGTVNLIRSTVSNNTAALQGGGLNLQNAIGTLTSSLTNSTISGNTANSSINAGGGVSLVSIGGSFTLQATNCTIANNMTGTANAGGGIFTGHVGGSSTTLLRNTIVAGNSAPNFQTATGGGGTSAIMSQGFNLTNDPTNVVLNQTTDKFNVSPGLEPLANNGGATQTHALLSGSQALDKGNSSGTTSDQRGLRRPFDLMGINNYPNSDGADIGAFEAQSTPTARTPYDYDGDGKTDIGIFRPSDGSWWYSRSSDSQFRVFNFGLGSDLITPGDFTGDGKTDIAVFRPSTGFWFIQRSEDNSFFSFPFGANGDIPAPADYDGDGKTDAAVFRPSSGTWFILNSNGSGTSIVQFGSAEDKPVPADFDGDGKADIAIFRPSDGSWWYLRSSDTQFRVYRFGIGTDKPVQGDYTGDGKADIAVWRPSTGEWFVQRSEDNSFYSVPFGASGDIPTPGDYDGDGKFDTAVFRPSTANWFVQRSTAGILITTFGANGDRPIPNAFVP